MKKTVFFSSLILLTLITSCKEHEKEKDTNSVNYFIEKLSNKDLIDSLSNQALNKGDTVAYANLKAIFYIGEQRSSGFLFYAVMMSNKYDYNQAHKDVYDILNNKDFTLDSTTKKFAECYLEKSNK